MTHLFFRKERPDNFEKRFQAWVKPSKREGDKAYPYYPKDKIIFQASLLNLDPKETKAEKTVTAVFKGTYVTADISVSNKNELVIQIGDHKKSFDEEGMANLLNLRHDLQANHNYYKYCIVACHICQHHATSSHNSPLISGCITANFNNAFVGYNLGLGLYKRKPFANPFSSGIEHEHFLIGTVLTTDCESIYLMGIPPKMKPLIYGEENQSILIPQVVPPNRSRSQTHRSKSTGPSRNFMIQRNKVQELIISQTQKNKLPTLNLAGLFPNKKS